MFHDAEIENPDAEPRTAGDGLEQEIVGFEVPMDQAGRVGLCQSVGGLGQKFETVPDFQPPRPPETLRDRLAFDEFHRDEQRPAGELARRLDAHRVRTVQARRGPGFPAEPTDHVLRLAQPTVEYLDRAHLTLPRVRPVDDAHAARAEPTLEAIPTVDRRPEQRVVGESARGRLLAASRALRRRRLVDDGGLARGAMAHGRAIHRSVGNREPGVITGPPMPAFHKVLIANRGEIACRIATVLRDRGVASVAVYSEADASARHVRLADEAVAIGPAPVAQSYLNQEAVIEAALRTGAEAIHPGYGLLSENAGFVRRVVDAGLAFIGPTPEVIDAMGDKARARETARAAGCPVVPGSGGPVEDDAEAAVIAETLGYPVLVKAAGGGGGIGMAIVEHPDKLPRALSSCRDRGRSSFGNPAVYLEKYIERPRHIEVQVLFDHHGHGVHLFERECSVQRRHQKVIEEAPSPFVERTPGLREGLTRAALAAAGAIGYRNAGTVEFVVGQDGAFYFIEMNTRLQVEHAVTEAITGVDLIGWQLDIAAGAPLTLRQEAMSVTGAAIECRIYAEDPEKSFVPRPGRIGAFEPPTGEGVRFDTGVGPETDVTPYYDPMIAKLVTSGADRATATRRAIDALAAFRLEGLTSNREFLRTILATQTFADADYDTGWLERFVKANRKP